VDLDRAREALRAADVTGSSDELPEEAGRRQMIVTVTGDRLVLEASDTEIIQLGRAAVDALRAGARRGDKIGASQGAAPQPAEPAAESSESGGAGEPASAGHGVIHGNHALSGSLGLVWQALHDSLEDIRQRAAAAARDAPAQAGGETPETAEKPVAGEPPAAPPEETAGG
jgi:ATP-dependent Clp protease ATP-binding subunit ClpC